MNTSMRVLVENHINTLNDKSRLHGRRYILIKEKKAIYKIISVKLDDFNKGHTDNTIRTRKEYIGTLDRLFGYVESLLTFIKDIEEKGS